MADARITQPSFTAGEIGPELYARKDLARYQVGLRKLLNGFVLPTGGVSNRAGLRFAAEVPDSAKNSRLMTFEAAADEAYLLVWGDLIVRPMSFGAYVDDGGPYTITTPYPHTTLDDLYMEQSNDVASLAHPDFAPRELSRFGPTNWSVSVVDFASQVPPPDNVVAVGTQGYTGYGSDKDPTNKTYKVSAVSADGEESLPSEEATSDIPLVLGFEKNYVTISWVSQGGGTVGASTPGGLYGADHATITYYNHASPLPNDRTITHIGVFSTTAHSGMRAKLAERTSAGNYTTIRDVAFNHPGGGWHDVAVTPYTIPASGDYYAGIYMSTEILRVIRVGARAYADGNVSGASGGFTEDSGRVPAIRATVLGIAGAAEIDSFNVYKEVNGIFGYIGNTPDTQFVDNNITPSFTQGPQDGRNPFEGEDNYPALVTFVQQRRTFARTNNQPQSIFMTQSANFDNMGVSSPSREDDAIEITLAARKKQDIYHIVPLEKGMIVFTRSGEWRITGREGDIITPSSILPEPQTSHGSAKYLRPLVVGEQLLFVPRNQKGVLELEFSIQIDRYKANDLGVLSRHLFKRRKIISWDYAKEPDGIIYCVMDDGTALTLTYLKDHEVWGWGRMETKGKILDVSVVPEGGRDVPYFIIERRIGGVAKRYVEFLAARDFDDIKGAFFVDSGASLDVPVTITSIAGGATTTLTKAAHGLVNGDEIELSGVTLYDDDGEIVYTLDGRWIVSNVTTNTFRITYKYDNDLAEPPVSAGDDVPTTGWSYYDGTGVYRKAVMTVIGLDHLAGRKCVALCDGGVIRDLVPGAVDGGIGVTFDRKYARVHIGLSYQSVVTTLDLLNPQGDDTGIVKATPKWFVRVDRTRGIKIGRTEENAIEARPPRDTENYGEPPDMFSGLFALETWDEWAVDQPCAIVQDEPLPMTILGLTNETEYGGSE